MYYILSLVVGVLIAVMVAFNGGLSEHYGVYTSTVMIHASGIIPICLLLLYKRAWPFAKKHAWVLYLGGPIGVIITVADNVAFSRISVSAILALGLLAQSLTGIVIDHYGLMGMPKHPFHKQKIFGLLLVCCGILPMIRNFDLLAVSISILAGACIVISRTLNAKLADATSALVGTFFNYLTGLIVSIPVWFLFGHGETLFTHVPVSPALYIYLGGVVGIATVWLSNIIVMKVSAFYLSLLLFSGQVFAGILIDALISQVFSWETLIGGVFVAVGLCANVMVDFSQNKEKSRPPEPRKP